MVVIMIVVVNTQIYVMLLGDYDNMAVVPFSYMKRFLLR